MTDELDSETNSKTKRGTRMRRKNSKKKKLERMQDETTHTAKPPVEFCPKSGFRTRIAKQDHEKSEEC
jgi:hypothetical protein